MDVWLFVCFCFSEFEKLLFLLITNVEIVEINKCHNQLVSKTSFLNDDDDDDGHETIIILKWKRERSGGGKELKKNRTTFK